MRYRHEVCSHIKWVSFGLSSLYKFFAKNTFEGNMASRKMAVLVAFIVAAVIADIVNCSPANHGAKAKGEDSDHAEARQVAGLDIPALLTLILSSLERILQLIKLNNNGGSAGDANMGGSGLIIG